MCIVLVYVYCTCILVLYLCLVYLDDSSPTPLNLLIQRETYFQELKQESITFPLVTTPIYTPNTPCLLLSPFIPPSNLTRWLVKQKRHTEAAQKYQELALQCHPNNPGQDPSLEDRIDYFSNAIENANCVEARFDLNRLRDEMEVAKLQQRIAQALPREVDRPHSLTHGLLSPSVLYNDFAFAHHLWEGCLDIIQVCDLEDTAEVDKLYSLLMLQVTQSVGEVGSGGVLVRNKESLVDMTNSVDIWVQDMKEMVGRLGRRFYKEDQAFVFPVDTLKAALSDQFAFMQRGMVKQVAHMSEADAIKELHIAHSDWVTRVLLQDVQIPFPVVFQACEAHYNHILQGHQSSLANDYYDERSKLYAAQDIVNVALQWFLAMQKPSNLDVALSVFTICTSIDASRLDGGLKSRLEMTHARVGALAGSNVLDSERSALIESIEGLIREMDLFVEKFE